MLENVKNLLSDGVTALGGILIVFGLVNLAGLLSESENSKQKGTIYGKHYRKQGNLRGIESYSPRAGRVIS